MRYYLSPFLHSHSLHLVVGPDRVGKTTYTLQMINGLTGVSAPGGMNGGSNPPSNSSNDAGGGTPWQQFPKGDPPESIWYVDMLRPRLEVLAKFSRLGIPVNSATPDSPTFRGPEAFNVLTTDQIIDARAEGATAGAVTFAEILRNITARSGGGTPDVLIIDAFSMLIPSHKEMQQQHLTEADWLREIQRTYLAAGGCLIGIQTYNKRVAVSGIGTPGTFALSGSIASLTEMAYIKGKNASHRRRVSITGNQFDARRLTLEFINPGILMPVLGENIEETKPEDAAKLDTLEVRRGGEISLIAIHLSTAHPQQIFTRGELVAEASKVGISRATVDRWLAVCRKAGSVLQAGLYGWYTLHPKPRGEMVQ